MKNKFKFDNSIERIREIERQAKMFVNNTTDYEVNTIKEIRVDNILATFKLIEETLSAFGVTKTIRYWEYKLVSYEYNEDGELEECKWNNRTLKIYNNK